MTKMCKTCMAREADPSEYHDDACPVFQEQAAYRVGFDAGRRAGIEAAASAVARIANGVPRSIESVRLLTLTADAIRALAAAPDAPLPEWVCECRRAQRGPSGKCFKCDAERSDAPDATPARMDAPGGPVCWCGAPSTYESGWCGTMHAKPPATECGRCGGTGTIPFDDTPRDSNRCPACGGSGRGK